MEEQEKIDTALLLLEEVTADIMHRPAVVVMPPDSGAFVIGNKGGFLQLAIASLKAAQGEQQKFNNAPWITGLELDWGLSGFKPDENAHTYMTKSRSGFRLLLNQLAKYIILSLIVGIFISGFVTALHWVKGFLQ